MATSFPSGWHVVDGTIGTDIDTSTTSLSGGVSVHFPSGGSGNVVLYSDWIALPDSNVTEYEQTTTVDYIINVMLRASNTAANKDVSVTLRFANQARDTTYSGGGSYSGPLTANNTWEAVGLITPLSTIVSLRWVRIEISRPTDTDFDLYVDSVEVKQMPIGRKQKRTSVGTLTGTWTTQSLPTKDWGNIVTLSGGNTLVFPFAGTYLVTADMQISAAVDDGDIFGLRIGTTKDSGTAVVYHYGPTVFVSASYTPGNIIGLQAHAIVQSRGLNSVGTAATAILQAAQHAAPSSFKQYSELRLTAVRITDR